jgi:hypothetical protein
MRDTESHVILFDMNPQTPTTQSSPAQAPKAPSVHLDPVIAARHQKKAESRKSVIYRIHQFIWYVLWVIEVILAIRIVLKLLGASTESIFVTFVYGLSQPLVEPFYRMFPDTIVQKTVFEWSAITASFVYALGAYALVKLIKLVKPTSTEEVEATIDY